jgi:hypothetical protein
MEFLPMLKGMGTWVPGLYDAARRGTGGTVSARYCYAVWLRHLALIHSCGLPTCFDTVAELGPGESLGIGLAAMLTGASRIESLDVVRYADSAKNERILAGLVELMRRREPIPDEEEFPAVYPRLQSYRFPSWLDEERLSTALDPGRIERIGEAIRGEGSDVAIDYFVPWQMCWGDKASNVDLVISQAALEHVEDIESVHRSLARGLRIGGITSHVIDLKSHGMTATWDGHLQYGDSTWKLVKGRRPYLLNRRSPTDHLRAMEAAGFEVLRTWRTAGRPGLSLDALHGRFRAWTEEDRSTTTMVVVARRIR